MEVVMAHAEVGATVAFIGHVESVLTRREDAPRQPDEGGPSAWLVFNASMAEALQSLRVGDRIMILTWLDRARRDVLAVHPRDDAARALAGVFSTRSPDRPNPIGLHEADVTAIEHLRVQVRHLEALNGTPILDVKPLLPCSLEDR
jgi:tRNA-Thr(GGU) m(6)t(6)A37 methyltransferase TsaA